MHHTPIYLPDALPENLKTGSLSVGISISEPSRHALEQDIEQDPVTDGHASFARLKPLASFADVDSDDYVRTIRGKSRILRTGDKA